MLASKPRETRSRLLDALSPNALAALPYLFDVWGRPDHQLPPEGDWTTWAILGGRGAGKTRAGAEWVRAMVEGARPEDRGRARRVALVAETWQQARDVMVLGESGLLAITPPDRRPEFVATRRQLTWPNGAVAHLFSASDPESLRGPQFDLAWSDELAKWRRGVEAWDMLQFGLRLGETPRQVVTTTPRDVDVLRAVLADPATVTTTAPTAANAAFLAPDFMAKITRRYEGTFLGRQELEGALLEERPDAMFRRAHIEAARVMAAPALDRLVVAVDPPATSGRSADACGIVIVGRAGDAFYVLADWTVKGVRPVEWAARVVRAYHDFGAQRIVAESNQGGEMIATLLRQIDSAVALRMVHARVGKAARAEPVSALYEQGRVRHVGCQPALEDQLCRFGAAGASPDRVDALVWAVTELMALPAAEPRVR